MDSFLFSWLTGFVGRWPDFDRFAAAMGGDHFLRSAVPVFIFGLCWFAAHDLERRARLICGLAAMCLATLASVALQGVLNVHVRPVLDPSLGINPANSPEFSVWLTSDHSNSFPSDTSTLYFGLATIILLERRALGVVAMCWTLLVVALPRVYFGYHYPSDILAGWVGGSALTAWAMLARWPSRLVGRLIEPVGSLRPVVDALLIVFFADMVNLFGGSRHLASTLLSFAR